jgi:hypothetical protein
MANGHNEISSARRRRGETSRQAENITVNEAPAINFLLTEMGYGDCNQDDG